MSSTHEQLFEELNRRYFKASLPEYRIILTDDLHAGCSGCYGRCHKEDYEIHLDKSLQGEPLIKTLLHEMAHAAVQEAGHEEEWLAEMKRLSDMGAPTYEDWAAYQDRRQITIFPDIKDEAFEMGCSWAISWENAKIHLGVKYDLTVSV